MIPPLGNIYTMSCSRSIRACKRTTRRTGPNDSTDDRFMRYESVCCYLYGLPYYYKLQIEWKPKNRCLLSKTPSSKNTSATTTVKSKTRSFLIHPATAKTDSSSQPPIPSSSIPSPLPTKTKKHSHLSPLSQDQKVSPLLPKATTSVISHGASKHHKYLSFSSSTCTPTKRSPLPPTKSKETNLSPWLSVEHRHLNLNF